MEENGIIESEDEELYIYGLEIVQVKLIAGILAFVLSIFIRTTLFLCLLLVFLIPIRKYAGGIHAKSKWVCLVISEAVLVIAELAYKFNFYSEISNAIMLLLGSVMIIIKSPYESVNHRLTDGQRKKYRRISYVLCLSYLLIYLLLHMLGFTVVNVAHYSFRLCC